MGDQVFQHVDLTYLERMASGEEEVREELLALLLVELPREMDQMREAFAASNLEAVERLSHSLKSTLHFVGNSDLAAWNSAMGQAIREGRDQAEAASWFAKMEGVLPAVLAELHQAQNTH